MKRFVVFIFFVCSACQPSKKDQIIGQWEVHSRFYKEEYDVVKRKSQYIVYSTMLDDGTTFKKYSENSEKNKLYTLNFKKDKWVDAVSGATKSDSNDTSSIILTSNHRDTIRIRRKFFFRWIEELWTRKKPSKK
jgi:hypothetical protein